LAALACMASTAARFSERSVPPSKIGAVKPEMRLHAVLARSNSWFAASDCCPTAALS